MNSLRTSRGRASLLCLQRDVVKWLLLIVHPSLALSSRVAVLALMTAF